MPLRWARLVSRRARSSRRPLPFPRLVTTRTAALSVLRGWRPAELANARHKLVVRAQLQRAAYGRPQTSRHDTKIFPSKDTTLIRRTGQKWPDGLSGCNASEWATTMAIIVTTTPAIVAIKS